MGRQAVICPGGQRRSEFAGVGGMESVTRILSRYVVAKALPQATLAPHSDHQVIERAQVDVSSTSARLAFAHSFDGGRDGLESGRARGHQPLESASVRLGRESLSG